MKKTITFSLLLFAALQNKAQITPSWVKFTGPSNYQNYDVKEVSTGVDSLGNIYTAASASDTINNLSKGMLVKYNPSGIQQWIQYYDDISTVGYNGTFIVKILVDKAGNSYSCGYGIHNSSSSKDFMIAKYNNAGVKQWIKYWDGGQNERDYVSCATFDKSGNIIIAGNANFQGVNQYDIAAVKYTTSGTELWSYLYNNPAVNLDDNAYDVAIDVSNNVFITGNTYGVSARDMVTIKLNSSGVNQWTKIIAHSSGSNDEYGYGITTDNTGNSYVTGALSDWATIKYDVNGNVIWTHHQPTTALNRFTQKKVMLDRANNVIITGDAFYVSPLYSELEVNKLNNTTGAIIWTTHQNFGGIDNFTDAKLDTSNNIYVSGYFEGPLSSDISSMVLTPSGVVTWTASYTNPTLAAGGDRTCELVLDNNKNIILVGTSERRGSVSQDAVDVFTLKYSAAIVNVKEINGNKIDVVIFPNPSNNVLNIKINDNIGDYKIDIVSVTGQSLFTKNYSSLSQSIDISSFSNGIYFLNIYQNNSIISTSKIIKH